MIEIVVQIFGELLLQIFGELLVEFGLQTVKAPFRRKSNPLLAAMGYALLGALAGLISLWLLPQHLTPTGRDRKSVV